MQLIDRRTFLAGCGASAYALVSTATAGAPLRRVPRELLAFYYGWYGTAQGSGTWRHWPEPGARAAAPILDRPILGLYDSHDPEVIQRHGKWLKQAGTTGIISSWWGRDSFEDHTLALLCAPMREYGLKVSAYIEQASHGLDGAIHDLEYLVRRYAREPNWLRVDGRPVIFIYGAAIKALTGASWAAAADAVAAPGLPSPVLIGDLDQDAVDRFGAWAPAFEGIHNYVLAAWLKDKTPAEIEAFAAQRYPIWKERVGSNRIYCATVMPGFDDRLVPGRSQPRPKLARAGLGTFDAMWRGAIATSPQWVLLTSFNEWHEGSEIEPSNEYGDATLRRCRDWSNVFFNKSSK